MHNPDWGMWTEGMPPAPPTTEQRLATLERQVSSLAEGMMNLAEGCMKLADQVTAADRTNVRQDQDFKELLGVVADLITVVKAINDPADEDAPCAT